MSPPTGLYAELLAAAEREEEERRGTDAATRALLEQEQARQGTDAVTASLVGLTRGVTTRSGAGLGVPASSYVPGQYTEPADGVGEEEEPEAEEGVGGEGEGEQEASPGEGTAEAPGGV